MNANIYGKKTVAALIAAVMVLCGMAVIMSESADAEPEFNAGAVAEGFMDTISLADPYRTLVEDVDITDAVVFDGSTLELNADTVYIVRDGTVVDLVGKELVLGAGATLYFEGSAKIDLGGGSEQGTIAFGEDSRFAAPGFTFFNDLFDASAEPTRVLACNGNPILVKTVVDQYGSGFGIGSESAIDYVAHGYVFKLVSMEARDDLGLFNYIATKTADMGVVGIASCEAWDPEENKLTAENVTELLAEDTKAIVIRTLEHTDGETLFTIEGFHMTIIGSPDVHDITDLDFTISISFRTLKADMGQAKIEIQSGESDSVVYVSAKYDNEAGALKSTIVLNNLGGTVDFNIAQDGNDLAVHVENTMAMALITSSDMEDFQIEIGTMVDLISIDAETENGEIHHVAKNFLIDGKTAISTSQISGGIAAVLMDLIAEFEGEVSLGELKLAYGETTIFFNGLRIDAAGLNAVAETFSATNVNVDGVSYDSVVAFDGEKLPAALSGVFAVTPFSYEAGLIGGSAPAGLITLHVETGRTTFNGETVAYPNGTGLLVEKPVVFHGVADLAVKAGDVVALIGTGTITLATDAKDVTNGDVIDISSGDVVISDENLAAMPGNDVVLKNDKVSITLPKSAMSKMIDGRAVSLSADVSIGVTAYDVLSKLSDADKQKVQGAVVIDIDASTAAVTDDLGNIYLVIPVDLQQLGMKKSAISAYYNNNGVLEKVRAIYYEENGQGYVKVGTTHFSEYIICEELELGQKDNSIVHILMTLIVVVIAIAAILVIRENSKAKA